MSACFKTCPTCGGDGEAFFCLNRTQQSDVADAARRWANLTSPETIEKAAVALYGVLGEVSARLLAPTHETIYHLAAEAVLRSVEETT